MRSTDRDDAGRRVMDGAAGRRAWWLDTVFALAWVASGGLYALERWAFGSPHRFVLPVGVFLAVLVATALLWPALRWERDAGRVARLAAVAFAVGVIVIVLDTLGAIVLVVLAVVNLVFVYRPWVASVYVVAFMVENTAVLLTQGAMSGLELIVSAGFLGLFYGAVVVGAEFVRRGLHDKRRSEILLRDLERAHDELRERSARIRELTIASERARMGREMHDAVGQHLTAAALALRTAQREAGDEERRSAGWNEVEAARQLVATALEETRRTVRAMRPAGLASASISEALAELVDLFRSPRLQVDLETDGAIEDCNGAEHIVVYRTVQEALTNVARHSGADRVTVSVRAGAGVEVMVRDNGGGHATSENGEPPGVGLTGLRERAASLGGTLTAGAGERGFTLALAVPSDSRR